jgi:hypothetical protein
MAALYYKMMFGPKKKLQDDILYSLLTQEKKCILSEILQRMTWLAQSDHHV